MAKYDFGPARVDFSAIGNLGQAFFEPYDKAKKQSALDALGRDVEVGNYRAAAAKAAQAGNPELVKALIGHEEKRRELAQKQGGLSGRASLGASGAVGEIDQARTGLAEDLALGDAFESAMPQMAPADVRTLLAKFGLKADQVTSRVSRLSPGERTRAAMALLQARGVTLLVLDEPTNHLDLPAIEQLEEALESYDGHRHP